MRNAAIFAFALTLAACTPNGIGSAGSGGGGGGGVTHIVDLNLTVYGITNTPFGQTVGTKPAELDVAVGDSIVFKNADGFAHTSTSIPVADTTGETQFPSKYPFKASALNQGGSTLSGGWTSGALQAGATSQTVTADKAGTYLYGCFFHYGGNMRGAIVAQ
jgi:plastocyanin